MLSHTRAPLPVVSMAPPPPGRQLHLGPVVPRGHTLRDAAGQPWMHADPDTLRAFLHRKDARTDPVRPLRDYSRGLT